ncbi:MAG: 1-acyl-sn-glycerol-3-phosphate acyltransferase [Tannerella sp.]|jgi:1-acyl-sn-glycerol-3-phosphate acyltransferase|nr:1-acyl-sn-glycerol-3-phosphate acyltransferase [Tannerella sp.]
MAREEEATGIKKPGIIYRAFRTYIRFVHNKMYYRNTYRLNVGNIPAEGTPLLIVSNHQNCMNDPLGILMTLRDRKPNFITRADIFSWHPLINAFLRAIGLLPAFRIDFEGEEALGKNEMTFRMTERELLSGRTIMMFPEAGHQDKHWLKEFSLGYAKLAFEAAEIGDFQKDIWILPACNHYSDYFHIQEQFLVKFGTPISIRPYYELYRTKPRTAQREVNRLVRKQIEDLMLDIRDLENYRAIDFIRDTYGKKYALSHQFNPKQLPDKLLSDRALVANLAQAKAENEPAVREIYQDAITLKDGIRELKTDDSFFEHPLSWGIIAVRMLLFIALFPLWIFSLWPNALNFIAPALVLRRMTDKMFTGTFLLALSVLVTIPLFYTLTFVLAWIYINVWVALIYLALLPALGLFAWYYRKYFLETLQAIRYRMKLKTEKLQILKELRASIYSRLDQILSGKEKNNE